MTGALSRGLDFEGVKEMEVGQIVDFCIEWNKANQSDDNVKEHKPKKRKATQSDWDAFFG